MPTNFDDIDAMFDKAIQQSHDDIMSRYGAALAQLLALSPAEIDDITPDSTDIEAYSALIAVVQAATRRNVSQAQLKARVQAMGDVAARIVARVPKLAAILA